MEKYESQYAIQPMNRKPITHKTHASYYIYCISSICINAYGTTFSKTSSTHKPKNGKKESG